MNTRDEYAGLFSVYDAVLLFWLGLVTLAVLFALVRYTRRSPERASKRAKAHVAEILYAAVIAGFVAVLCLYTFRTEDRVDRVAAHAGLTVRVTGFQWGWRFVYPGGASVVGDQNTPPVAAVPAGAEVVFQGTARDVTHSFYVPALRFKADVNPGQVRRWDLVFPHPGSYEGECAEYCGLDHTGMSFRIVAMTRSDFDGWLSTRGGSG